MPIEKILIGKNKPKKVYVGTNKAKYIYFGKKLVFADPQTLTISKGTGVKSVECVVIEKDGSAFRSTNSSITVGYGAIVAYAANPETGYTVDLYDPEPETITESKTVSFTATLNTYTVTLKRGTGVDKITYTVYGPDGKAESAGTFSSGTSKDVTVKYGGKITFTPIASTGYSLSSYTAATTEIITSNKTFDCTAKINQYDVTIKLMYGDTEYGDKLGAINYRLSSTESWARISGTSFKADYGTLIQIKSREDKPGFALDYLNVTSDSFNHQPGEDGIFVIAVPAQDITISVKYKAVNTTRSAVIQAARTDYNSILTKNAWTVSCSVTADLVSKAAGAPLGYVLADYTPKQAVTTSSNGWCTVYNGNDKVVEKECYGANITIGTDGYITASAEAKHGEDLTALLAINDRKWRTKLDISTSWEVPH